MMTVYFTAEATTKGGREGHVKSNDLIIDLDLAMQNQIKYPLLQIQNNYLRQAIQLVMTVLFI